MPDLHFDLAAGCSIVFPAKFQDAILDGEFSTVIRNLRESLRAYEKGQSTHGQTAHFPDAEKMVKALETLVETPPEEEAEQMPERPVEVNKTIDVPLGDKVVHLEQFKTTKFKTKPCCGSQGPRHLKGCGGVRENRTPEPAPKPEPRATITTVRYQSLCCHHDVKVSGGDDDGSLGGTKHHICFKCGEPCDVQEWQEKPHTGLYRFKCAFCPDLASFETKMAKDKTWCEGCKQNSGLVPVDEDDNPLD